MQRRHASLGTFYIYVLVNFCVYTLYVFAR